MSELLQGLNNQQQAAVTATEGFIRVIAGAGAGKTKALTHRYAHLVKDGGIHPRNILCVTFTNKAAGEMKRRVRQLVGDGNDTSLITTYHGFCVRVLRADMDKLFYPQNFIILDRGDQKTILEEIYDELEIKMDHASFQKIFGEISKLKADTAYVADMINPKYIYPDDVNADIDSRIIQKYLARQKKVFGLDFDDLVNFTFHLFDTHKDVLEKWQDQLHYIQVDEFQDSSRREMRMLDLLSELNGNLFVVGDPDQNIYEWRGARVEILVDFDQSHPGTETIILNQNYRSSPQILAVANCLIDKNKVRVKKDLFTEAPTGSPVIHLHAKDEKSEIEWIVGQIKAAVQAGNKYSDIAMLYRASFLSRYLEQALIAHEIPYQIWGGVRFYERMEIRDMLAYLRLVAFRDDMSFLRIINVPRRRMGKTRIGFLRNLAEETGASLYDTLKANIDSKPLQNTGARAFVELIESFTDIENLVPSELLQQLLTKSGYEGYIRQNGDMERLDNLVELYKTVVEFERGYGEPVPVTEYLRTVALYQSEDTDHERDAVKLMTIHASKGLEFPYVFVVGLNEGVLPSSRTLEERNQAGLEEERRLCFVAITRAMKQLYLTESEGYSFAGGAQKLPTRFLFDIDEDLYQRVGVIPKALVDEMRKKVGAGFEASAKRLDIGARVKHPMFGDGTVVDANEARSTYDVLFDGQARPKPIKMDFNFVGEETELPEAELTPQAAEPVQNENTTIVGALLAAPTFVPQQEPDKPTDAGDWLASPEASSQQMDTPPPPQQEPVPALPKQKPVQQELEQPEPNEHNNKTILTNDPNETNLWKRSDIPHSGWTCIDIIDLGQPSGTCGMCNQQTIRYVHVMDHPQFPRRIGAGRVCAGRMEGDEAAATEREREYKKLQTRRKTFLKRKWKTSAKGNIYTKYKGHLVIILPDMYKDGHWKYKIGETFSMSYPSLEDAKIGAFDAVVEKP